MFFFLFSEGGGVSLMFQKYSLFSLSKEEEKEEHICFFFFSEGGRVSQMFQKYSSSTLTKEEE